MQRPAVVNTSEQLRPRPDGGLWKDVGGSWKTHTVRPSTGEIKPGGVKLAKDRAKHDHPCHRKGKGDC